MRCMRWSLLSPTLLLLLSTWISVARCAINLDGSPATDPAPADEDVAEPIDGMDVYWPDQHDCPLPCVDYGNIHSWIPYFSANRLKRCDQPMLLQFSVDHPIEDPATTVLIRSCTLGVSSMQMTVSSIETVENPKMDESLSEPGLNTAPACKSGSTRVDDKVRLHQAGNDNAEASEVYTLLEGMKAFFDASENCDENFLFGYYNDIVASVYIGQGLAKDTANSALQSLADHVERAGSAPQRTMAEACSTTHKSEHIFGVAVDTTGDLSAVQGIAADWSHGRCARTDRLGTAVDLSGAEIWEAIPSLRANNGTMNGTANRIDSNITLAHNGSISSPLYNNGTGRVNSFIQSISSLLLGTGSAFPTSNLISIATRSTWNLSGTVAPWHRPTGLAENKTSLSVGIDHLRMTITSSSFNVEPSEALDLSRNATFTALSSAPARVSNTTWSSNSHDTIPSPSSSVEPSETSNSFRNSTSAALSSSANLASNNTPSFNSHDTTPTIGSSTTTGSSAGSVRSSISSQTLSESSSTTRSTSATEISTQPSSPAAKTLTGDGTLSCDGGFRMQSGAHSRSHNSTLTCNGALTSNELLSSNKSISCEGSITTPSNMTGGGLTGNGILSCNGTFHNNGTLMGNMPINCNGTLSMPLPTSGTTMTNWTVSCNGTLGGNGTVDVHVSSPRKRQAAGTCATHLIKNGDTCFALGQQYDATVDDIEGWNGKTWGWQGCEDLLVGYIICVGPGGAPMPAPQQGVQCGPLKPGTAPPSDPNTNIADLNPCPLKACCSNWGFCGVFPAHCTVNAPPGAAPGAKNKDAQNTCVSNCGTDILRNSAAPSTFGRVGYYSAFAYGRPCLHLPARRANTDGSYTIIHWAFAEIDPSSWTVVINDPGNQWEDFKSLQGVKRVISFGGWAYSTEPATFNIIRQAIITNFQTFTTNVAKFIQDEGLDGVDIDWEYPGATDILVNGRPIGGPRDGALYLRFLNVMRSKIGPNKLLAIAAPASYWYLKAFPIGQMSQTLDYIVYMTYDLHGQWDYGNPNAFDQCDSGKCIRSHVNLTETDNSLGMVTKAGVATNKIYVGEASYGRTFRMAQPGCWGEMCEFTGSRTQSDANPGRCTGTGGYLAMAEIMEILMNSGGETQSFHDQRSNSDILLHNGDYVSYMTTTTKDTRRNRWRRLNFAGSIDWALDLQSFSSQDAEPPSDIPEQGDDGCVHGEDLSVATGDLCEFSCSFGYCPPELCECMDEGPVLQPPRVVGGAELLTGIDDRNRGVNQLCTWAYRHGYHAEDYCIIPEKEEPRNVPAPPTIPGNGLTDRNLQSQCMQFTKSEYRDGAAASCARHCEGAIRKAREEGKMSNYGCMAIVKDGKIPWVTAPLGMGFSGLVAQGKCDCDNPFLNFLAESVLEALPAIGAMACATWISAVKFVIDVGVNIFPPSRKIAGAVDGLLTAAETINYVYKKDQDPQDAYSWWLSPCQAEGLLPEEARRTFEIMDQIGGGASSFREPRNIERGSGKKGDDGNPTDRSTPRRAPPQNTPQTPRTTQCRSPGAVSPPRRLFADAAGGWNVVVQSSCGHNGRWTANYYTATAAIYPANGRVTTSTAMCGGNGDDAACRHYSSAISVRPAFATQTCPQSQASQAPRRFHSRAVGRWKSEHPPKLGWREPPQIAYTGAGGCQVDEWPPAYLLGANVPQTDQLVRYIPGDENGQAGRLFRGFCLRDGLKDLSDSEFIRRVGQGRQPYATERHYVQAERRHWQAAINVEYTPVFRMGFRHQVLRNDGLDDNMCFPSRAAAGDPGFALLNSDPYNNRPGVTRPNYNYRARYNPPGNGRP